jgi:hypothetical protein
VAGIGFEQRAMLLAPAEDYLIVERKSAYRSMLIWPYPFPFSEESNEWFRYQRVSDS